jgi:hypothetical protein
MQEEGESMQDGGECSGEPANPASYASNITTQMVSHASQLARLGELSRMSGAQCVSAAPPVPSRLGWSVVLCVLCCVVLCCVVL